MNETYFEQLLQWLARCPALTGIDLRVDDLPPAAGTGALFPKGVEQTDRWQNLLGQVAARQKMQLVLRLNLPFVPGDANLSAQTARRLLELQAWVAEQSAANAKLIVCLDNNTKVLEECRDELRLVRMERNR